MDNPIFKLEGVVHERSAETLQDFEGPLDLILFLLSKNKIEIQDIPIALILEQYLAYLEQRKQLDLEVASEFITMAAHLMYIKTRMLLSIEDEEAQNEMEQLIQSLKERQQKDTYLRIRTLTETLGPMSEFGRNTMTKNPEPMERGKIYEYDHEKADLVLAMQSIFDRAEKLAPPPRAAFEQIVQRAVFRLRQGGRDRTAAQELRHHALFAAVPRREEPQRDRGDLYGGAGAVPRERDPSRGRRDRLHGGLRAGRTGNFYIVRNVWHWKRWTYMRSARRWRAFSLPPASR